MSLLQIKKERIFIQKLKKKQSQEIIFSKQNVAKILKTNGVNRMQHVQNSFQNTYQES